MNYSKELIILLLILGGGLYLIEHSGVETFRHLQAKRSDYLSRAIEYQRQGLYKESLALLTEALHDQYYNDKHKEHYILYLFGNAFTKLKQYDIAISYLNYALEKVDYKNSEYLFAIAIPLVLSNDLDGAVEALNMAIAIDDNDPRFWSLLGDLYFEAGKTEEAVGYYQKYIEIDPENPEGYYNIGAAYLSDKKYDIAYEYFQMSLKKNPIYEDGYFGVKYILNKLGKEEEGRIEDVKYAHFLIEKDLEAQNYAEAIHKLGVMGAFYLQVDMRQEAKYLFSLARDIYIDNIEELQTDIEITSAVEAMQRVLDIFYESETNHRVFPLNLLRREKKDLLLSNQPLYELENE